MWIEQVTCKLWTPALNDYLLRIMKKMIILCKFLTQSFQDNSVEVKLQSTVFWTIWVKKINRKLRKIANGFVLEKLEYIYLINWKSFTSSLRIFHLYHDVSSNRLSGRNFYLNSAFRTMLPVHHDTGYRF